MQLSIVIPLYNEEANLQRGVIDEVIAYAKKQKKVREILLVDDGSTDNTVAIIKKQYIGKYPYIRLLQKKHSGKAYSVIAGIKSARSPYVLFSDADLATPIQEADSFITALHDFTIVIGSRSTERKGAPFIRKAMALGFITVRTILVGLRGIRDTQCGFKAFEKKAALDVIRHLTVYRNDAAISGPSVGAGFDLEFLYIAQKLGYSIKSLPVSWRHVETKRVNFLKDSLESLHDMCTIRINDLKGHYRS